MLTVKVTRKHITDARGGLSLGSSTQNPVARAICEALGEPVGRVCTWAGLAKIEYIGVKDVQFPDGVAEKLREWVTDGDMGPFSFEVDLNKQ